MDKQYIWDFMYELYDLWMINPPTTVSLSTCKLDAFKIPSHPLGLLFLGVLVDKDVDIVLTEETNRSPPRGRQPLSSRHIGCWCCISFRETSDTNQWLWARNTSSHWAPFEKRESKRLEISTGVSDVDVAALAAKKASSTAIMALGNALEATSAKEKSYQRRGWKGCCQDSQAQKRN